MRAALLIGIVLVALLLGGGFLALGPPARTGVPVIDLRAQTTGTPQTERRRERAAQRRERAARTQTGKGATPAPPPAPAPVGDNGDDDDDDDDGSTDD